MFVFVEKYISTPLPPGSNFLINFAWGLLISKWSWGIWVFLLILILSELTRYVLVCIFNFEWTVEDRLIQIAGTVTGWLIGRMLYFPKWYCPQCRYCQGKNQCTEHSCPVSTPDVSVSPIQKPPQPLSPTNKIDVSVWLNRET